MSDSVMIGLPFGQNTEVQVNEKGRFRSFSLFTYDSGSNTLGVGNITGTALGMLIQPRAPTVLENAGNLSLYSQHAVGSNSIGGGVLVRGGNGTGTGGGGQVRFDSGNGGASGPGGAVFMLAGDGSDGGEVYFAAGDATSATGTGGGVAFAAGSGLDGGSGNFGAGNNIVAGGTGGSMSFNTGSALVGSAGGSMVFTTLGSGDPADDQGAIDFQVLGGTASAMKATDNAVAAQIGFFGVTPVVRPTTAVATVARVAVAGGNAVDDNDTFGGYTIGQIVNALKSIGILT